MRSTCFGLLLLLAACAANDDKRSGKEAAAVAGGVVLANDAQTLVGNASVCTRPATIELQTVQAATPEGREIVRDDVREGSARYGLLHAAMHRRIVAACDRAARRSGNDLVVRSGDITDDRGLPVADLTASVVQEL